MSEYLDLLIVDNDLALDPSRQPLWVEDRACIAQDIGHMIRESGLLVALLAERSKLKQRDYIQQLELLVETDVRLIPGTARITEQAAGIYIVVAKTLKFGDIKVTL